MTDRKFEFHELDTLVRNLYPSYRIYEFSQVEKMREDVAAYGGALSHYRSITIRQRNTIKEVQQVMEDLRAARLYEYSDRIRASLEKLK